MNDLISKTLLEAGLIQTKAGSYCYAVIVSLFEECGDVESGRKFTEFRGQLE